MTQMFPILSSEKSLEDGDQNEWIKIHERVFIFCLFI